MNNNQFRRLVLNKTDGQTNGASPLQAGATPTAKSSLMPMTPRAVKGGGGVDFARQVRERNAALQPKKQFKSSAPKGVKFAAGYTDRARARAEAEEASGENDIAGRVKALEEQMKLGQISVETFEALRDEITGGDVAHTHLVKGLDRKLLERVKRGEDVYSTEKDGGDAESPPDVDDELDKLGEKEVEAVTKEKAEKKGIMAPPVIAGVKRSRDEIMAELKAQRKAAAEAKAAPILDNRWRNINEKAKNRIQIDHKGREVLITVDADGVVKKQVRKRRAVDAEEASESTDLPDASKPVLGADAIVPEVLKAEVVEEQEEDDDDDIFEGVGVEYNPLGDEEDDDSSDDEEDSPPKKKSAIGESPSMRAAMLPETESSPEGKQPTAPRNYFKDNTSAEDEAEQDRLAGVQELLKKAAKMDPSSTTEADEDSNDPAEIERQARLKKRAEMLSQQDRDLDDMDMGFGGSRYDDAEEGEEGKKQRLSEWKGSGAGEDDDEHGKGNKGGHEKKKRKPKKRKDDVNNANDIMRVIEARKGGEK